MIAIRDIAADFADGLPEEDCNSLRTNPMHAPLLYCTVVDEIRENIASLGDDFRIKPYWTEETLNRKFVEYEQQLVGRKAYLEALLAGIERRMSEHYVRLYSLDDFVLFKIGDSVGAGLACGNDLYKTYNQGRECGLVKTPDVICRLELVDFVSEYLPAVVAQGGRWSVGFPEFKAGSLEMTADIDGKYLLTIYQRPFMIRGLLPVLRETPLFRGPYR